MPARDIDSTTVLMPTSVPAGRALPRPRAVPGQPARSPDRHVHRLIAEELAPMLGKDAVWLPVPPVADGSKTPTP